MSDGSAVDPAEHPGELDRPAGRSQSAGRGWFESVLIALLLALGIRHFLVQAYKIPSGSMIPTLLVGDQLIASKISYGIRLPFAQNKLAKFGLPERGEVVVFRFPEDPDKDFIKRVIALPGDRIAIREGRLVLNGELVPREKVGDYRHPDRSHGPGNATLFRETVGGHTYNVLYSRSAFHAHWNMDEIELADDQVFVMGDNRDQSNDSRFWGPVDADLLEGHPLFIHWSWNGRETKVRWDRIGTDLN